MRYVTVVMKPEEGYYNPVNRKVTEDPAVTPVAIHHVELLDDGTVLQQTEVRGDLERLEAILAGDEHILDRAVFGDREGYAYTRYEPTDLIEHLIESGRENELMVQWPVEYTDEGHQRITMVGHEQAFAGADTDGPEGVEMEIVEVGEYDPDEGRLYGLLTDRQREVLETAVELGYYEDPRQATQADVAEAVEIATGTAGEHLRKIEATLFDALVR
jgi:hypothetical protein